MSVIVIAQLLAILISLIVTIPSVFFVSYFEALLLISVFVQWIALSSITALCAAGRYLAKLPNLQALVIAYLLLLCVTMAVNEGAVWILWLMGKLGTPRPEWYGLFHMQNLAISAILDALVLGYFLAKHELRLRTISEADAKMQALQSRIRPHFVFNSMNIIASLTRSDPVKAESAIEDMSELFRMMLNDNEYIVPVRKEIEVAQKYLAIEKLRLDARLNVVWDIGTFPRKAVMPTLTLQPLLENAIIQGIEPEPYGGTIIVKLWEEDEKIRIEVTNPLPKKKAQKNVEEWTSTIENIRLRFGNYYGDAASISSRKGDNLYHVSVSLPIRMEKP